VCVCVCVCVCAGGERERGSDRTTRMHNVCMDVVCVCVYIDCFVGGVGQEKCVCVCVCDCFAWLCHIYTCFVCACVSLCLCLYVCVHRRLRIRTLAAVHISVFVGYILKRVICVRITCMHPLSSHSLARASNVCFLCRRCTCVCVCVCVGACDWLEHVKLSTR